ncbi:MAG: SGNH/GDSL hydrolase family protein [Rhodospirillaceae bacterium]|nr:SGNH/GDSL hydrolase family protein [Rhodospirillaceae bacterium]
MTAPRAGSGALNVVIVLATVLVGFGLFEVACRTVVDTGLQYHIEMWKYAVQAKRIAGDPAVGHEHVPGIHAKLMGADVALNATGDRNRQIASPKPPGTFRVLMLGDSVTFGWGVDQDRVFAAVVERELNGRTAVAAEVVNLGVGNYNTAMEVAAALPRLDALAPDLIVLNYFINDAEPTPVHAELPWFARTFYAYPVAGGAWDAVKRRMLGGPDWMAYYRALYADDAPGWTAAQAAMTRLADAARARNVPVILANIPELRELSPYPFAEVNTRVAAAAAERGLDYVDLLPALAGEPPPSLWVTVPDPHPNARAHELIGRALADHVARVWLMPARPH